MHIRIILKNGIGEELDRQYIRVNTETEAIMTTEICEALQAWLLTPSKIIVIDEA